MLTFANNFRQERILLKVHIAYEFDSKTITTLS